MGLAHHPDVLTGFSLKRATPRFVPTRLVTVVLLKHGVPFTSGTVENLSEGGMCLLAYAEAIKVKGLRLKISFYGHIMLEADARVAWSEGVDTNVSESPHGIEFVGLTDVDTERLRRILCSKAFTPSQGP